MDAAAPAVALGRTGLTYLDTAPHYGLGLAERFEELGNKAES